MTVRFELSNIREISCSKNAHFNALVGVEAMPETRVDEFETQIIDLTPRLRAALLPTLGFADVDDAVNDAVAWALENMEQFSSLTNPAGYLYRVAITKGRRRWRRPPLRHFPVPDVRIPDVEPGLIDAMKKLPLQQRTVAWLRFGCDFSRSEVAEAINITASTVATHETRALERLRKELGVRDDD